MIEPEIELGRIAVQVRVAHVKVAARELPWLPLTLTGSPTNIITLPMLDSTAPIPLDYRLPADAYYHLVRALRVTLPPPLADTA